MPAPASRIRLGGRRAVVRERHARGVPAVADELDTRRRGRSPHAAEVHAQARLSSGRDACGGRRELSACAASWALCVTCRSLSSGAGVGEPAFSLRRTWETDRAMSSTTDRVPRVTLRPDVEIPQLGFGVFQVPPKETEEVVARALRPATATSTRPPRTETRARSARRSTPRASTARRSSSRRSASTTTTAKTRPRTRSRRASSGSSSNTSTST